MYAQLRQHVLASIAGRQEVTVTPHQLSGFAIKQITDLARVHRTSLKEVFRVIDRANCRSRRVQLMQTIADQRNLSALSMTESRLPSGSHRIVLYLLQYAFQDFMRMRKFLAVHLCSAAVHRDHVVVQQAPRAARIEMMPSGWSIPGRRGTSLVREGLRFVRQDGKLLIGRQVGHVQGRAPVVPHLVRALAMPTGLRIQWRSLGNVIEVMLPGVRNIGPVSASFPVVR